MGKKSGSREGFKQVGESGFEKLEVYILIQRAIYFIYFFYHAYILDGDSRSFENIKNK